MSNDIMQLAKGSDITTWTDDKRKDFVQLYKTRAADHIYLLEQTALKLFHKAKDNQLLGNKNQNDLEKEIYRSMTQDRARAESELQAIAEEKAKELYEQLPSLKSAAAVLSPDFANDMDTLDTLQKKGSKMANRLNELSSPISMGDLDQSMTIGAFRTMVQNVEKERAQLVIEMNAVAEEARVVKRRVDKALFKGIPGLSEELSKVIRDLVNQAREAKVTLRRVEEQILFGDSKSAMDILATFEKDEEKAYKDVGQRLRDCLNGLKVAKKTKKLK